MVKEILTSKKDDKYRTFVKRLVNTNYEIIGVRIPELNLIVKRILSGEFGEPLEVFEQITEGSFEEVFVKGAIIAEIKNIELDERLKRMREVIPLFDNWSHCDSFSAICKFAKKNRNEFWLFLQEYLTSDKEFEIRFGVVSLIDYYMVDEYFDRVICEILKIKSDEYYVQMAIAWLVATGLSKNYEKFLLLIKQERFSNFVHNKSIQKAIESRLITLEQKEYLRTLKV